MCRFFSFLVGVLCLAAMATAQTKEFIVPAGTLLQCTLDEPNFSSGTVHVGDPLVCHISSLGMFGNPVFPRGAYLSGRFADFRDPGHFFGKGWLKLEFETLTLPGGTFPVSAKVISVPHYQVDADGSVHGHGHPRRDAIEWTVPILWPEKLITLPLRGPRPTLKGETRILLRLLEDVAIPRDTADTLGATLSKPSPPKMRSNMGYRLFPRILYGGTSVPAAEAETSLSTASDIVEKTSFGELNRAAQSQWRAPQPTLLILKDGQGYVATNYWIDASRLAYVGSDGSRRTLPLNDLDLQLTVQLNRERGVPFVLRANSTRP
jgi:hypothetical protein